MVGNPTTCLAFRVSDNGSTHGRGQVERGKIIGGQLDIGRSDVFLEVLATLRTRNRDDILREHPRQGELRRRHALGVSQLRHLLDELKVRLTSGDRTGL